MQADQKHLEGIYDRFAAAQKRHAELLAGGAPHRVCFEAAMEARAAWMEFLRQPENQDETA